MIVKPSLLLLNAALTFAQGQIPIGGNLMCLASDDPNACCTGGETTGQISLNDRKFIFTCSSELDVYDDEAGTLEEDAYECASKCANDPSCKRSTFRAQGDISEGNCFLGVGTNPRQTANKEFITFSEIPPSCLESGDPNKCCTGGQTTGEVVLNDRKFIFTCSSELDVYDDEAGTVEKDAYKCASKCANDPSCRRSTFRAQGDISDGNCFLGLGTNPRQTANKEFITFSEVPIPCLKSGDPNKCCSDPAKKTGEELIDGVRWKWTCESHLKEVQDDTTKHSLSFQDCLSQCSLDVKCNGVSYRFSDPRPAFANKKCYHLKSTNTAEKTSKPFIAIVKVVDDDDDDNTVDPPNPGPDPDCDGKLKDTQQKLDDCLKSKVDAAELARCEADKAALVTAEKNCRDDKDDLEKKKEKWRQAHQTCEKEKGDLGDEKQKCEKDKTALSSELIHKNDEIDDLKRKLKTLQQDYDTLNNQCNGEGPNGKCRTNLFDAEPRDDLCIIDAGSEQFKIYYGKFDQKPSSFLNTRSANSFKACAERCATFVGVGKNAGKKCVRFSWDKKGDDRACYLIGEGKGLVPTTPSDFSSGILL